MEENYLKEELYNLVKSDSNIFDFIQSGSLDGIWYWDLENPENEWMSPKFWETLGYNPEEKTHKASEWQDIIFQEDLKLAIENFEKHLADSNHPYDQVVRYKHKNNSTVWIRCRGLAIRDSQGKPLRMLGAHTDITNLKEAEKEINRLSNEYEKVFNGTQDAMFLIKVIDCDKFRFVRNNIAHQNKTGITLEILRNKSPQELLGEELGKKVSQNYEKCVEARKAISYEEVLPLPGGQRIWQTTLTPIIENDLVMYIVGSANDITEQKNLERELKRIANFDKLTKIPNRRFFFEILEKTIKESKKEKEKFALLFLDLDGFKEINDKHGHEVGDEVLIISAKRLQNIVREEDFIARMGGDEFTAIIKNVGNRESVEKIAEKIHGKIKEVININGLKCKVSSSVGIAIYPEDAEAPDTLLKKADMEMYKIKKMKKEKTR